MNAKYKKNVSILKNVMSRAHSPLASCRESRTSATEQRAFLRARILVTRLSHLVEKTQDSHSLSWR
jgi:hypothetical protein